MSKCKFRVIAGSHSERKGNKIKVYEKGSVFESDSDLMERFQNKFEIVHGDAKVSKPSTVLETKNNEAMKAQAKEQAKLEAEEKAREEEDAKLTPTKVEDDDSADDDTSDDADDSADDADKASDDDETPDTTDEDSDEEVIEFKLSKRGKGKWFVSKYINGEKQKEKLNDEPLTKAEANKLLKKAKKALNG